jgi:tetratricopeptide (TPR) repeat protein
MNANLFGDGHATCDEALELASTAIPILEELGSDRDLGRAWLLVAEARVMRCEIASWGEACEHAVRHYVRAGWSPVLPVDGLAASLTWGAVPVGDALRRCHDLVASAAQLAAEAGVRTWEALLEAMRGDFERARQLLVQATTLNADLGRAWDNVTAIGGQVARLEGDRAGAAEAFSAAFALAERQGRRAYASWHGAELADVLIDSGRYDDAAGIAGRARPWAHEEDVAARFLWRLVEAKLLAAGGASTDALDAGADARRLADSTDALVHRARLTADLARLQHAAGKRRAARSLWRAAELLYEQKGHAVGVEQVRAHRDRPAAALA